MRALGAATLLVLALACGASRDPGASGEQAVTGGTLDTTDSAVVAIFRCTGACSFSPYLNVDELCSGTLIAPNLVLTARHCVAPQLHADSGVACSQSTFDKDYPASNFVVTTAKSVLDGGPWYFASDVATPSAAPICGNDVALLTLTYDVSGATPIAPRLDVAPAVGEPYTTVGFGGDGVGGLGVRNSRGGLAVKCIAPGCEPSIVGPDLQPLMVAGELEGDTGNCGGDSGGPALDAHGELFGVISRAQADTCTLPIYERVDAWAAWLASNAALAAERGSYPLPDWAARVTSAAPDAGASTTPRSPAGTPPPKATAAPLPPGPVSSAGGCSSAGARGDLSVIALALFAFTRRRRTSRRSSLCTSR